MTDFNPFAAVDSATEYVPEEVVAEESSDGKRTLLLLGGLAVAALGAGSFFFLGGGDSEEEFTPIKRAPRAAAAVPSAAPVTTLPVASTQTLGRNPFRALYVEPAAAPAEAPAAPTSPTTTDGGTTTPIIVVDGGPAPAPAPAQPAPAQPKPAEPAPAPAPAYSIVQLKSVAAAKDGTNPTGTFDYDGKALTGAPGDVMDGKLLVISIQQDHTGSWFANLQLGDGEPFEVHQNQKVVAS